MASLTARPIFSGLSKNTFLLALASLFAGISTEMLYSALPSFLTPMLHASGSIVGLVEGFAQATQNVVQGFSGAVSDKLHKRKAIALLGYLMAAIGKRAGTKQSVATARTRSNSASRNGSVSDFPWTSGN
jgi:MFS family permease